MSSLPYLFSQVTFLLDIIDSDADKESVRIEVIGPSTKPDCTVNWHGGQGTGQFVPSEPGHHMVCKNQS